MDNVNELNNEQIKRVHDKYLIFKSLNKTAKWVARAYGIECTRHHLSNLFHRNGLPVQPPNGRNTNDTIYNYVDKVNEFAATMVKNAWDDVRNYENGKGNILDWMTASWFIGSGMYEIYLQSLFRGLVSMSPVEYDLTPDDIDPETVITGHNLYKQQFQFWVVNNEW